MKTRCALTAVFLGVLTITGSTKAQVNIPDENLKQAVKEALGIEHDPNESEMLLLTQLNAEERSITDLTGLDSATNLVYLNLGNNNISDISALAELINLMDLNLSGLSPFGLLTNQISDISPLAGLVSLSDLDLSGNKISDISALGGLTNLSSLNLRANQVSEISSLSELVNLNTLLLSFNQISDISALSRLINLTVFKVDYNQINDISALGELIKLTTLSLYRNQISDISALSGLVNLDTLFLSFNQISDISVLGELTSLSYLQLVNNEISDISILGGLTKLTYLHLFGNDISDISPLANLFKLDYLDLRENPLDSRAYSYLIPEIRVNNPDMSISYDDPEILDKDGQLEIRGRAYCIDEQCEPGAYQLESILLVGNELYIPERLEIAPDVTIDLVDHFRDHQEFLFDVLYVKTLVLGSGSTLNLGSQHLYYETLQGDPNQIVSQPLYISMIGYMDFTDENEFKERVTTNNDSNLTFAGPIYERFPDPTGALYLQTLQGEPARAKTFMGRYSRDEADEITVSLNYLFERTGPEVSINVYLSDKPQLLPLDDPSMLELGRILPPPPSFPGSVGSRRYGTFELDVDVSALDTEQGLWLEVILSESAPTVGQNQFIAYMATAGSSAVIDDKTFNKNCRGICMDLTDDDVVTLDDYHLVTRGSGRSVSLATLKKSRSQACIDRGFSRDGYSDAADIHFWSYALSFCPSINNCTNYCALSSLDSLSLDTSSGGVSAATMSSMSLSRDWLQDFSVVDQSNELLLLGKGKEYLDFDEYVGPDDQLYGINVQGSNGYLASAGNVLSSRTGIRLVKDDKDTGYVVDSKAGILTLDGRPVIEPDTIKSFENKTVYIGLQDSNGNLSGRPILDAAFDEDDIYIVPVMVEEPGREIYLAAAQLEFNGPDYYVKELYYDPTLSGISGQNPNLSGLREIEVDSEGHVYVLNVHRQNESDLLWCFDPDGTLVNSIKFNCPKDSQDSVCLGTSIPDPVGLSYDPNTDHLYVASGIFDPNKPHQSLLYTLNAQTLDIVGPNTIVEIQHVTDITTDGGGSIWITGFSLPYNPDVIYSTESDPLFYALPELGLVRSSVPPEPNQVPQKIDISQRLNMTLPTSILWTGP